MAKKISKVSPKEEKIEKAKPTPSKKGRKAVSKTKPVPGKETEKPKSTGKAPVPAPSKQTVTKAVARTPRKNNKKSLLIQDFHVVGIGASAGGLEAFEQFFTYVPPDTGMAFVIVSHLDPTHKSILSELLRSYTRMPVKEVEDGVRVLPNCIYVIPPDCDMAIMHGDLHLMQPSAPRGLRQPIDFFFRSLSQDKKERAIAIVLSGTGTEGTLGLREIKGQGGMVMVQDPETAKYNGMPRSAIGTGIVDYILPPDKMAEPLIAYIQHPLTRELGKTPGHEPESTTLLQKILIIVRSRTGHDFSFYKESTIIRRIERRMAVNEVAGMSDYIRYLQQYPDEVDTLFTELLIGVTNFFRDPPAFDSLKERVMQRLVKGKEDGGQIRIWVPGCSTGEEAYSLAMLYEECKEESKSDAKIQIFATDIDPSSIETARSGSYPHSIAVDVSVERLKRFFSAEDNIYRVKRSVRDMVVFAVQNVVTDPPFSKLDLISCRNLLIYMGPKLQKKVLPLFHYSLIRDGYLFLGTSETIGEFSDLFSTVDRKEKIFQRKDTDMLGAVAVEIPTIPYSPRLGGYDEQLFPKRVVIRSNKDLAEKALLDTYSASGVLISEKGEILYFHGATANFLQPPQGEASLNVMNMAREGMKLELANAIRKCSSNKQVYRYERLRVKTNGDDALINLTVYPILDPPSKRGLLMVVFEEIKLSVADQQKAPIADADEKRGSARIRKLEQELASTKEYLQTTIEELETTNEELKSTNEELQSSNEELQSTNEELETAKEEQQSVNEELVTVNAELQQKIDLLSKSNDDMNNLLASTQIGTIFLDRELNIQRFTPAVTEIVNLIDTDRGRPMRNMVYNLERYDRLIGDAQEVLNSLATKEREVATNDGKWYLMRLLPYRTTQNAIEGVVITFVDITDRKKAEKELQESQERYRGIGELIPFGVWTSGADGKVTYFSESFLDMLGKKMGEAKDHGWVGYVHPDDKGRTLSEWKSCVKSGSALNVHFRIKDRHGDYKTILSQGIAIRNDKGEITSWAGLNLDMTDQEGLQECK
jgi:two-component system, chemotaxis family, CheB/CheR fusion protein